MSASASSLRWWQRLPLPMAVGPSSPPISPAGLVVLLLIGLGIFLRVHDFGFPRTLLFDEHHFVENARNYLAHQADWNDHPPLGKLFIAGSIRLFGDNPVGWRAPALLCGAITVVVGALVAARLFRSAAAGWIAAALLGSDGFLISYSRAGLLDGYLGACSALALLLASGRWTRALPVLAAGALGGVACSIKFSGVAVLAPMFASIAMAPLRARRRWLSAATIAALGAVTYVIVFAVGLKLTSRPAGVADVIRETRKLIEHHAGLTAMTNPWTSSWPTWAIPTRPLILGEVSRVGSLRVLSTLGNLATWWAGMVAALAVGFAILSRGLAATLSAGGGREAAVPPTPPTTTPTPTTTTTPATPTGGDGRLAAAFVRQHGRAALLTLVTALAFLAPWILARRDSYIYHFLPAYVPLVLLLAGLSAWCAARRPLAVLVFLLLVLVVAAYYAPIWSFLPIDTIMKRQRLLLPGWR
jgi:dolichyl-phosphate-mannose-protein mannosyltransferase